MSSTPEPGPSVDELLELVQRLPDALFRCKKRADGRIDWTFSEGRLAQEFGVTTQRIEGKPSDALFPAGDSDALRALFDAAFDGSPGILVDKMQERYFRHHVQPVHGSDGKVEEVMGFVSEVTEMVQAQRHIKALNAQMTQRVQNLHDANDAMARANQDLERVNQDLDSFAYSVSHDLRAPLTVVQNLCYVLQARYKDALDGKGLDTVQRIRDAAGRMDRMITDILRFSRAARAPLQSRRVDLTAMAHAIADESDHEVTWAIEDGLEAIGDPMLLRVLLENLLGNAVKYSRHAAAPTVWFRRRATKDGVAFEVADNGIGFGKDEAARMFEPFHRLENALKFQGSGVGLGTALRAVERHGGRIWAEPGDPGARFLFTLPGP